MVLRKRVKTPALKLYAKILRLHLQLPPAMKYLGDQYAKDEFRRHIECDPAFVPPFLNEWSNYARTLEQQLRLSQNANINKNNGQESFNSTLGKSIGARLSSFSDEQLGQLNVLKQEAQLLRKPSDDEVSDESDSLDDYLNTSNSDKKFKK
ncbi:hypothetical protein MIR68_006063 [Amoeboaphelidium protococcarum]|nr:hypothetical protein MIR68_006063 [Amoeboaphelidium protococcarum]